MKKFLQWSLIVCSACLSAQTELVFVFFKDKPNKAAFYANPLSELSQKSLERRTALGISLDDRDAPVEVSYIQNLNNLGYVVVDSSKWLNGVALNLTSQQISQIQNLTFVDRVESFVKDVNGGKTLLNKEKFPDYKVQSFKEIFDYGAATQQINQINLRPLHELGFTGKNITIAVLDTGFPTVDTGSGYARIRNSGKIKGGYNFVSKNSDIYDVNLNAHGSYCFGVMAGYVEEEFVGSAPDADFYLYATEKGIEEIPEEELYWIEGAEQADRVGADIISASLGYADYFDDTRYNYTYADMTGSRSFVARGAQIAAEKGIIVMSANGNAGMDEWFYLLTPADNAKVFSVGAVQGDGQSSWFSSFGPNALGVVKPDASARGTDTALVFNNGVTSASGTSLSTPLAAGAVASLLQGVAKSTDRESIKNWLRQKASLYPGHDNQKGWGILNLFETYQAYQLATQDVSLQNFQVYPNPSNGSFKVKSDISSSAKIFDASGRLIKTLTLQKGENTISLGSKPGIYHLVTDAGQSLKLILK